MKNRILVVPGNTDLNRGDQALVWESIRVFEDVWPDVEVYLYESGANETERRLQKAQSQQMGFHFITRILQHPRVKSKSNEKEITYSKLTLFKWGITAISDLFVTLLLLSRVKFLNNLGSRFLNAEQRKSLELFPQLSALVVKGGGFLHSYGKISDAYVMYYFLFDLMLANRYGVKTIILPNSIGPLKNKLAKKLVKFVLSKSAFISVREEVSQKFVQNELQLKANLFPDLGFFLKGSSRDFTTYLTERGFNFSNKNIAITLRPYRFDGYENPDQLYNKYLSEMAAFIQEQVNRGYRVTLMAHTLGPSAHEDDRIALLDVFNNLPTDLKESVIYLEDFDLNSKEIQKLYSYYDVLIGTRFHSVIFAFNERTPAVAIAYGGNKSYGIMKDLGAPEFVIGIDQVNQKALSEMMLKIEKQTADYQNKIDAYHEKVNKDRVALVDQLKTVFK